MLNNWFDRLSSAGIFQTIYPGFYWLQNSSSCGRLAHFTQDNVHFANVFLLLLTINIIIATTISNIEYLYPRVPRIPPFANICSLFSVYAPPPCDKEVFYSSKRNCLPPSCVFKMFVPGKHEKARNSHDHGPQKLLKELRKYFSKVCQKYNIT